MEQLSVCICDDSIPLSGMLERMILDFGTAASIRFDCEVYNDGERLLRDMQAGKRFDLVFLDYNLTTTTGAAVGQEIRKGLDDLSTQIVFMTCMEGSFEHLMEYQPLRFLRKPLSVEQVAETLTLAMRVLGRRSSTMFQYRVRGQTVCRLLSDILYFEGADRCVCIVCKDGKESFYGRLRDVAAELEPKGFWHIHRGFLVNSRFVRRFYSDHLLLENGISVPISQAKRKSIREIQEAYLQDVQ